MLSQSAPGTLAALPDAKCSNSRAPPVWVSLCLSTLPVPVRSACTSSVPAEPHDWRHVVACPSINRKSRPQATDMISEQLLKWVPELIWTSSCFLSRAPFSNAEFDRPLQGAIFSPPWHARPCPPSLLPPRLANRSHLVLISPSCCLQGAALACDVRGSTTASLKY
jgi:hypothetical protein